MTATPKCLTEDQRRHLVQCLTREGYLIGAGLADEPYGLDNPHSIHLWNTLPEKYRPTDWATV